MIKNTVMAWLFIGLSIMFPMALDAAMASSADEDYLDEGVEFAEEWLPHIPRVEAVKVDEIVYYFYDPSFIDCDDVINVFAGDEKDVLQTKPEPFVITNALTYLVGWHKGWTPFNKPLRTLVTAVKRCFDGSNMGTWNSIENKGFIVIDVDECALSAYPSLINEIGERLGIKSVVDVKAPWHIAVKPILELYNYFVKGGYTIVFVSDLKESKENRAWLTHSLKTNGYTAVDTLYLYPDGCKDSTAEYNAKIRHELAEKGSVIATIASECSSLQGKDLGLCVVWVPSPFSLDVGDTSFYAKLHDLAATAVKTAERASVGSGTASGDPVQVVAAASSSQSSSGITVASQSSTTTNVVGHSPVS